MPVEHVEIDQVSEDQAGGLSSERFGNFGNAVGIIFCGHVVIDAAPVVDVVNLADAENRYAALGEHIHQHGTRRRHGEVVAPFGAAKIPGGADEWPGDHAADAVRRFEHGAGDLAHAIEFGHRNNFFVRGNLKNTVAGGIYDRKFRFQMLGAEVFQDFGSGSGNIPDHAGADGAFEFRDQVGGKAMGIN